MSGRRGSRSDIRSVGSAFGALDTLLSSDSPDWCTPAEVLQPVRAFAPIRFDPFSNPGSIVGALESICPPDDSLTMSWPLDGLNWANPPYGRALAACAAKIRQQAERGAEILTLVPARTDTRWWHDLAPRVWCAWRGRITFLENVEAWRARVAAARARAGQACEPSALQPRVWVTETLVANESAPFPAALCYHGWRPAAFAQHFRRFGEIYAAPASPTSRRPGRPEAERPSIGQVAEFVQQGRSIRQIAALLGLPKNRIESVRKQMNCRTAEQQE